MKHFLVLLNAPPYSGKDTLAEALIQNSQSNGIFKDYMISHVKLAEPLVAMAAAYCGLNLEFVRKNYSYLKNQHVTGFPHPMTLRELMIFISENIMKPNLGNGVWANMLQSKIINMVSQTIYTQKDRGHIFIVSDLGFPYELEPLMPFFGIENSVLFRIHREGYTFKGDSREYVFAGHESVDPNLASMLLINESGNPDSFIAEFEKYLYDFITQRPK